MSIDEKRVLIFDDFQIDIFSCLFYCGAGMELFPRDSFGFTDVERLKRGRMKHVTDSPKT